MLVDGKWTRDWNPVEKTDEKGGFVRPLSGFRNWITPDGAPGPTGEGGFPRRRSLPPLCRLHLPVGFAHFDGAQAQASGGHDCLHCGRARPHQRGWAFGDDADPLIGARYMHEIYTEADPAHTGRATIPVLWDTDRRTIVSNESADIVRMLNSAFDGMVPAGPNLYPDDLAPAIDELNDWLYDGFNNGVYRAGFATTQEAYDEAFAEVFDRMDGLEARLSDGRDFLHGDRLTESDIRAFVTLIRFEPAYYGQFKCNRQRLADYPRLLAYTRRMLNVPGLRETVDIDHIKRGYYSIKTLNPSGIVPLGPDLGWMG